MEVGAGCRGEFGGRKMTKADSKFFRCGESSLKSLQWKLLATKVFICCFFLKNFILERRERDNGNDFEEGSKWGNIF